MKIGCHRTLGLSSISGVHVLNGQRGSASPLLPSPLLSLWPALLPSSPHSFFLSFLRQTARAVGTTDVRPALDWGSEAHIQSSCPSSCFLSLPRPVTEWGSGSARSGKPPELMWFWAAYLSPARTAHLLALQQSGCDSLDSKNEVRSDWFKCPTSRIPWAERGRGIQIWKGRERTQKQLGYFETK